MLVKRDIVTGDVLQVDAVDVKHGTNVRAEISGCCHCGSGKDHEDQQRHFTRRKKGASLTCFLEAVIVNQLQTPPNDEQGGPITDNVSPNSNVVPEVSRQKKGSDNDQSDAPEDHSCVWAHDFNRGGRTPEF